MAFHGDVAGMMSKNAGTLRFEQARLEGQ